MSETQTAVLLTFRDRVLAIAPPWLRRGFGEKLLYAIGVQCDAYADALVAGAKQRFPGLYSFDALPALGRERRIARGRNETQVGYAARLAGFLALHQTRGGPYALLTQLYRYFAPDNVPIDLVYYAGSVRYRMDADGAIVRDYVSWTPDSNAAKWARWWLFYYTDQWAEFEPSDEEATELRLIPRQWNAAHPLGTVVLFPSGAEMWNWPPGRLWDRHVLWNNPSGIGRKIDVG